MSLTQFIQIPEVGRMMMAHINVPKVDLPPIKHPVITGNTSRMGAAIDYGIRFFLQAKYNAKHYNSLVAEIAANMNVGLSPDGRRKAMELVQAAKEYLGSAKSVNKDYAYHCWQLANLDVIARARMIPTRIPSIPSANDLDDFMRIMKGAIATWPPVEDYCLLNPTFGWGSNLVNGADADVVQDGMIIDIKTVRTFDVPAVMRQLVGYAILDRIDGVDNKPPNSGISTIGVYLARHEVFRLWPIAQVIDLDDLHTLREYFEEATRKLAYEPTK